MDGTEVVKGGEGTHTVCSGRFPQGKAGGSTLHERSECAEILAGQESSSYDTGFPGESHACSRAAAIRCPVSTLNAWHLTGPNPWR